MRYKAGAPTETLPADRALKRFLARMDPLMGNEMRFVTEASLTHYTLERLLPSVDPPVRTEAGADAEAFATLRAVVRFLTSVDSLVANYL